jgi:uncharacterized protein
VIPIKDHPLGATFAVRVHPSGTARTAITGTVGDALKLTLSAPPVEGRANIVLAEFLSQIFDVQRSGVQILAGIRSRNKVIRIAGSTAAELERKLREHFTV